MTKYAWPLPGEGVTAQELMSAEIRVAIPGLATYSLDGRRDAVLAELIASIYNGSPITYGGPLIVGPGGIGGGLRVESSTNPTGAGVGIELFQDNANGIVQAFNRTSVAYVPLRLIGSAVQFEPGAAVAGKFDQDNTAGNTRFLLYDVTAAAVVRVSRGAADSGGTGFRVLRVPN